MGELCIGSTQQHSSWPLSERAMALSTFFGFLANYYVLELTKRIQRNWSNAGMCMFFGVLNVFNILFVLLFIKETKGIAEKDIPTLFGHVDKEDKLIAGQET